MTVRKVTFVVRAAPALGSLLSFSQATRKRRSGLGERLEREVTQSLTAAARALDPILAFIRWLGRRGLARASGYVDASGLAAETTVSLDLRLATAAALHQGSRVDSRAYTDLYVLRSLVRSIRQTELLALDGVLLGRRAETPRALLRAVDEACRETALADESLVPKAFTRLPPGVTAPAEVAAPATDEAASRPVAVTRPTRSKATAIPSAGVASATGSFGELPDDATSPPVAPAETLSARGLSVEAESVLASAGLTTWPCSPRTLTRTRRLLLIRLHPDRAGDGSEARFRTALKGFEDLARALAAAAAIPPVRAPDQAAVTTSSDGFGQWPPPPEPSPLTASAAPRTVRQSFKRSSKA